MHIHNTVKYPSGMLVINSGKKISTNSPRKKDDEKVVLDKTKMPMEFLQIQVLKKSKQY